MLKSFFKLFMNRYFLRYCSMPKTLPLNWSRSVYPMSAQDIKIGIPPGHGSHTFDRYLIGPT